MSFNNLCVALTFHTLLHGIVVSFWTQAMLLSNHIIDANDIRVMQNRASGVKGTDDMDGRFACII